jgi:hypothetical protein
MYIVIDTKTNKPLVIIKERIQLSKYIGVSVSTIQRKETFLTWQTDKFTIYYCKNILLKSKRGGKRDSNFKNE